TTAADVAELDAVRVHLGHEAREHRRRDARATVPAERASVIDVLRAVEPVTVQRDVGHGLRRRTAEARDARLVARRRVLRTAPAAAAAAVARAVPDVAPRGLRHVLAGTVQLEVRRRDP